ncbi:MAG: YciI family protein [Candidatus Eremiobacteraeota bacterium]|nr:YciI family protein [Candidatus Eremiobacteraeota bacterium]
MRFMVIVKATKDSESGVLPTGEQLAEMGAFNDQLIKAGVMLAGDGLQASKKGARITFAGGKPAVTDGPFAETKELVAGFWIVAVKSKEEAIEWFSRAPFDDGELEIRQVFEAEDFGVELTAQMRERDQRLRREISAK